MTPIVAERFRRAVHLHLYKNLSEPFSEGTPLILGISGPPGEGKTYNTELLLKEANVQPFLISGGQLEHMDAGRPAELIRDTYLAAGKAAQTGFVDVGEGLARRPVVGAAIVINDFDTGVGDWGELVQYTVNRQTVFGELMHLCDFPRMVAGELTARVPIIVTGNDFTSLHGPLTRSGRMEALTWLPTVEERQAVLSQIYPELLEDDIAGLEERYRRQPISFFSHVRGSLRDDDLWREVQTVQIRHALAYSRAGTFPDVGSLVTRERIETLADKLVVEQQYARHLPPIAVKAAAVNG